MEVRQYTADDRDAVLASMELLNACRVADSPWLPQITPYRRERQVRHGWDGPPDEHYLGWVEGEAVATADLEIGEWDNRDFAWVNLFVHPALRRRGHGSELLGALTELGGQRGCTKIGGAGWDGAVTTSFAAHHGFSLGAVEVTRVQYPLELPPGLAEAAYDEAASWATDYELVRLTGRTPEALLPAMVALNEAINDAPVDDLEVEDEVFTPERLLAHEAGLLDAGYRHYRIVARHRATGVLAGHTVVVVDTDTPEIAHQHDTSVLRTHRGHRLGLLLKAAMMRWLAVEEPQVAHLDTSNAASNLHMVAVNDRLGYRVMGRELEFQRRLTGQGS